MEMANQTKTFLVKWESIDEKESLLYPPTSLTVQDHEKLAKLLTFPQLINDGIKYNENPEVRLKYKWKQLHYLHFIISKSTEGNLERAFTAYNESYIMTVELFIITIINEFFSSHEKKKKNSHTKSAPIQNDFKSISNIDQHLRWLYWSFDHGRENQADWRDIVSSFKVLQFFRLIRPRTVDLILMIFDIYSDTVSDIDILPQAHLYIPRIFYLPCITDSEFVNMTRLIQPMMKHALKHKNTITRKEFIKFLMNSKELPSSTTTDWSKTVGLLQTQSTSPSKLLSIKNQSYSDLMTTHELISTYQSPSTTESTLYDSSITLVDTWRRYCWIRLPTELRLIATEEAQDLAYRNADHIFMHYKLNQAIRLNIFHIQRYFFKEWKLNILRESEMKRHLHQILYRRRKVFFQFWNRLTVHKGIRRRRRMLSDVMGSYAIKARCFVRIKLFIYNSRREKRIAGGFDRESKLVKLGASHIREFQRLKSLRVYYHRWWNEIAYLINNDVASRHNFERILLRVITPWQTEAHATALQKRMDMITWENKIRFDRMMEETQVAAEQLVKLEKERKQRFDEEQKILQEMNKKERFERARLRMRNEKTASNDLIIQMQHDIRRKRIMKELQKMKESFQNDWQSMAEELLMNARNRVTAYLESPENKLALKMKFDLLKREFFAAPTKETAEREKILTSAMNIAFLFLESKLKQEKLTLQELTEKFDKDGKGSLNYDEFRSMIRWLQANLNPLQISSVIRGVDKKQDYLVNLLDLEREMKITLKMGVPGSPWKVYVDPILDVICYHNFDTDEKIYENEMKDDKLKEILISNLYGEADYYARLDLDNQKQIEWTRRLQEYMVKRIQYLYRQWSGRKIRRDQLWKVQQKQSKILIETQKICVKFIEKSFIGWKIRMNFQKQLHFNYEKVWDVNTGRLFWYNRMINESTWTMPLLLRRYQDVTNPPVWIPIDEVVNQKVSKSSELSVASPSWSSLPSSSGMVQDDNQSWGNSTYTSITTQPTSIASGNPIQLDPMDPNLPSSVSEKVTTTQYWHVTARKQLPRKPDGLEICQHCYRNLAIHTCNFCRIHYCSSCHSETHGNPLGFLQSTKVSKQQYSTHGFVLKMSNFKHSWTVTKPRKCELCNTSKILAGIHCQECGKDLCRPCSRRIHNHPSNRNHVHHIV